MTSKDLTPEEYQMTLESGYYTEPSSPNTYKYSSWVDSPRPKKEWGTWDNSSWGKSTFSYDSIEKRIKRKTSITKAINLLKTEHDIIAKTYIGSDTNLTRKRGMYSISIANTKSWKKDLGNLGTSIMTWKKIPGSDKVRKNMSLLSELVNHNTENTLSDLFRNTQLYKDGKGSEIDAIISQIMNTFHKDFITDPDIDSLIDAIPEQIKGEIENSRNHGGISRVGRYFSEVPMKKKKLRITKRPDKFLKYPHLSKGRRINKGFIQGTDYRALRTKDKIITKRNKLLILMDGSGSMRGDPYKDSVNFVGTLIDTKLFDIELIYTTDAQVLDATDVIHKWNSGASKEFFGLEGAEGFEYLTDRLGSIERNEDYVIVLTDMCVPDSAERNLKSFIGAKKHMILSFEGKGSFNCNVRQVKKYEDMLNVITTLTN